VAPPISGPSEPVTLYVADDEAGMLYPQKNRIAWPEGRQHRCEELLRALLILYVAKSSPHPLGPGSDVRDVYLVEPGLAVIDLNADFANGHRSGVLLEELTIASLVETLSANVPGIARVKFLVDGKERETLAGHADLEGSYEVSSVTQMADALQPQ
jgi:spore germination protein GerM